MCGYMRVRLHAIYWQAWLSVVFFREPWKIAFLIAGCVCILSITNLFISNKTYLAIKHKKKNFMSPFYGWGSSASRLEPLQGGSLLFTSKFPEIPGTYFIDLRSMNSWVYLGASQWFWTCGPWNGNQEP